MLSVLCRALAPAQDCQKGSAGVPADNYCTYTGQHTRWNVLRVMFSSRKKPLYAANFHSKGSRSCNDTSRAVRATLPSCMREQEFSKSTSGAMERRARAWARIRLLEFILNLVRSETRPTSEASPRHPSRTANANPFSDASVQMQTSSQRSFQSLRRRHKILPNALCSMRTVDHGPAEIK